MATLTTLTALTKTKQAIEEIKASLEPVIQRLRDNAFNEATGQAQATVSLSIGMMKYMGARLQGLDQGRKADDPLRQELNQMRKVLAEIKARKTGDKETQSQVRQSGASNNKESAPSIKKPYQTSKSTTVEHPSQTGQAQDAMDQCNRNEEICASKKRNADGSKRRSKKIKSR